MTSKIENSNFKINDEKTNADNIQMPQIVSSEYMRRRLVRKLTNPIYYKQSDIFVLDDKLETKPFTLIDNIK